MDWMLRSATIVLAATLASVAPSKCYAAVSCLDDETCIRTLREGSVCVNGTCTNPFYRGGCFAHLQPPGDNRRLRSSIRTCSSTDGEDALENGYCRIPAINYTEVRIASHNWESAYFSTWIVQIILSELLDVPVSIETNDPTSVVDFYEESLDLGFGRTTYDWEGLETAAEVGGDCAAAKDGDSCAHFFLEGWWETLPENAAILLNDGKVEAPLDLGALGLTGNQLPQYTARRDPSLLSFLGLQGEENRRKLASRFLRPVTWAEYCGEVSQDNCTLPDAHSSRVPSDDEGSLYFLLGSYTGFFRATDKNDCDKFPTTCTGFFLDFPCGWTSYAEAQFYHMGIALEAVQFSYEEQLQIIEAANATQSDVMFKWWTPSTLYDEYFGTNAEFMPVTFPPPTKICSANRISIADRCSDVPEERVGNPEGACAEPTVLLRKVFSAGFKVATQNPNADKALWSPAYEAVKRFQMSNTQLEDISRNAIQRNTDKWNYDLKEAACHWVIENIDIVELMLPESYPRAIAGRRAIIRVGSLLATVVSSVALLLICGCFALVYNARRTRVIQNQPIEFLYLYLSGLFLIAVSSILTLFPTKDRNCSATFWLMNFGHFVIFVLLGLKICAINREAKSNKLLQRAKVSVEQMIKSTSAVCFTATVAFMVLSIFGSIRASVIYNLTDDVAETGEVLVSVSNVCVVPRYHHITSFGFEGVLLFYTLALGFLISQNKDDINPGRSLTAVASIHGVLSSFRFITFSLADALNPDAAMTSQSIFLSLDCFLALVMVPLPALFSNDDDDEDSDEPLPDLFLNTVSTVEMYSVETHSCHEPQTILLADLVGFTRWSSMREASHVFKMLETIYGEFDIIAEEYDVLKIETVGDCYVAATGIPDSGTMMANAVSMAGFAARILLRMNELCRELEMVYGPDTAKLNIRIGAHSGPVTGGFLRGKQSRFQLFGDSINVSSRMESTGAAGRIQFSAVTANLLMKAGGKQWLELREEPVQVKGKGEMVTYWLSPIGFLHLTSGHGGSVQSSLCLGSVRDAYSDRMARLVEWSTSELFKLLQLIVAYHNKLPNLTQIDQDHDLSIEHTSQMMAFESVPISEMKEVLPVLAFNDNCGEKPSKEKLKVGHLVRGQLRNYVQAVADSHSDNDYHNFAHSAHVCLSVIKYLNRITASSSLEVEAEGPLPPEKAASMMHARTFGIATDPLVQFTCAFAALIMDIGHPGIPNSKFKHENKALGAKYFGRSVKEQNAIDSEYRELRRTICKDQSEVNRFRSLLINTTLATDITDKSLKNLRKARWERAFNGLEQQPDSSSMNRKATAVIEHLMQAADVSHAMQHWHVYIEWNEKHFREKYTAYRSGRSSVNPVDIWYDGEIAFFDYYIVPLCERLQDCGIFGVSSDENLSYARANRDEWMKKGQDVVKEYLDRIEKGEESTRDEIDQHTRCAI